MATYVQGWTQAYSDKMEKGGNPSTWQSEAVTSHLRGPVVVVDPGKSEVVEDLQSSLPDYLKPKKPAAIRIVVWVDHYTQATGRYTDGSSALTWFADQVFVDARTHQILGTTELTGGAPPDTVYANGSREGSDISSDEIVASIVKWIRNTPSSG